MSPEHDYKMLILMLLWRNWHTRQVQTLYNWEFKSPQQYQLLIWVGTQVVNEAGL